jgi:putative adhesin
MRSHSRVTTLAILSVLVSASAAQAQSRGEVTAPRSARVNAVGARMAQIEARAGTLRIEGRAGLTEIQAHGTARASSRALLEQVRLTAERRGDVAYVIVEIPEMRGDWNDDDEHASLDLIVEVPKTLSLDVEDRSGDLEIRGVGQLDLVDHSGDATIEDVGGRLRVRDGSGDLRIRDVRGDVTLEDGSGGVHLQTIRGSISVDRDGSGQFEAENVTGSVRIANKGSGSVDVAHVGGDFVVDRKGTGSIEHRDVRGRVDVPDRDRGRRWRF